MNKPNIAIALGMFAPMVASMIDRGSASRSFLESKKFRERYFAMNQRYFEDDVDALVQAVMAGLWNADVPGRHQITTLSLRDLAGNLKGNIVLNPRFEDGVNSTFPVIGASIDDETIEVPANGRIWHLILLNLTYTFDDKISALKFSKRIRKDAAYRLKLKVFFKQTISHELYHLIDPRKLKGTSGKAIDQLLTERPTYIMNYVDNFWRKAYCVDDMLELVMNDPRKFWENYASEISEVITVDGKTIGFPVPAWGSTLTTKIINAIQESIREKANV